MDDEFYQDDDARLWERRGLSPDDARIEAEWERSGIPEICGTIVESTREAAFREGGESLARATDATIRQSGGTPPGAEVQQLSGGVDLPTFDGNTKDDGAKAQMSRGLQQYFPRALEHVAIISAGGAKKYDWDGWADVEDGINRYRDAGERHEIKHNKGEVFDPDHSRYCSEPVRHLGQKAWNALAVLELILRGEEV